MPPPFPFSLLQAKKYLAGCHLYCLFTLLGQLSTSRCLSALPGHVGRAVLLDGLGWDKHKPATYYSHFWIPFFPLGGKHPKEYRKLSKLSYVLSRSESHFEGPLWEKIETKRQENRELLIAGWALVPKEWKQILLLIEQTKVIQRNQRTKLRPMQGTSTSHTYHLTTRLQRVHSVVSVAPPGEFCSRSNLKALQFISMVLCAIQRYCQTTRIW